MEWSNTKTHLVLREGVNLGGINRRDVTQFSGFLCLSLCFGAELRPRHWSFKYFLPRIDTFPYIANLGLPRGYEYPPVQQEDQN